MTLTRGVGASVAAEVRGMRAGRIAPGHGGGHPPAYSGKKLHKLRRLVQQQPDMTLAELRERTAVACSLVAVHNTLVRLDLRFKKSRSTPESRTDRT